MTVALPLPYEDEHLYSVIARYMRCACPHTQGNATRVLFGRTQPGRGEILCGLDHVADQTRLVWGIPAIEIAERYTLLPYFTSFASNEVKGAAYAASLRGGLPRPYSILGLLRTNVRSTEYLRFCLECIEEDLTVGREPYWRRVHQLPGVFICPKHRRILRISGVPFGSWKNNAACWHALSAIATRESCPTPVDSDLWMDNMRVLEVIHKSTDLLFNPPQHAEPRSSSYYSTRAMNAGFEIRAGCVDSRALCASIAEMFGTSYLDTYGLSVLPTGAAEPWPVKMLVSGLKSQMFQPLQHLILGYFFEYFDPQRRKSDSKRETDSGSQYICPNSFAAHGPGHNIDRIRKLNESTGCNRFFAACTCGMNFIFSQCRKGTSEPVVERVLAYGNDTREYARSLKKKGLSRIDIADQMHLPFPTVRQMMLTRPTKRYFSDVSRSRILCYRKEWRELLGRMPVPSHTLAKKEKPRVSIFLEKNDKSWYLSSERRCWNARVAAEWRSRDEIWCHRLHEACERLMSASTPTRITRKSAAREAGLWLNSPTVIDKVPRCRAFLARVVESTEQFHLRRLNAAAREITSSGSTITRSKLLVHASLRRSRLTPKLEDAIDCLTSPCEVSKKR